MKIECLHALAFCFQKIIFNPANYFLETKIANKMKQSLGKVNFKETEVIMIDDKLYYVWPLSEKTQSKIRKLLSNPNLKFGFNATLEHVPRFECPECHVEITFYDQVAAVVESMYSPHAVAQFAEMLKKPDLKGDGVKYYLECENGHDQPILMGWAAEFGWTHQ